MKKVVIVFFHMFAINVNLALSDSLSYDHLANVSHDENELVKASPTKLIANYAIRFYREKIAKHSVARCPFLISCSHYAESAVHNHGVVKGIALFIDRHFLRENPGAILHYEWVEVDGKYGSLIKLNDSSFLNDDD